MSPTQRALAYCKRLGWVAGVAERWNPHAKIRQDLLGFCDLVVLDGQAGPLALQVTSGTNVAARLRKLEALPAVAAWLAAGARVEVWGFAKRGPRGKRKVWTLRRVVGRVEGGAVAWDEVAA